MLDNRKCVICGKNFTVKYKCLISKTCSPSCSKCNKSKATKIIDYRNKL